MPQPILNELRLGEGVYGSLHACIYWCSNKLRLLTMVCGGFRAPAVWWSKDLHRSILVFVLFFMCRFLPVISLIFKELRLPGIAHFYTQSYYCCVADSNEHLCVNIHSQPDGYRLCIYICAGRCRHVRTLFFSLFFPSLSFSPTSDYVSGDTGFVAHTNTSKSFLQFPHLPFFHTGMKNEVWWIEGMV